MEPRDEKYRKWIFTIPNVICMVRAVGSVALLALAFCGYRNWFVALFVVLTISDWIDGRLARMMHQRSDFGARLDSFADFLLYAALLLGSIVLCYETLMGEWIWLAIAAGSYFLTSGAGLLKYGRIPSYHTLAAKRTQFLVLVAGIVLVLGYSVWPMRIAALAALYTNVEATVLTIVLPRWHADVPSLWTVLNNKDQYFAETELEIDS